MHDYHVHSTYSDGGFLRWMIEAAESAGIDGVGIADHCTVLPTESAREYRREMGFSLDTTYERRRAAIDRLREEVPVTVFDAVEMDYEPGYEDTIGSFLETAGFDYALGSVHELEGVNVHDRSYFHEQSDSERRALVDRYFEKLAAMVESELFEIAAHVDLVERNEALRGFATRDHYERVARAFTESRTVPEINAGRVTRSYGEFHPAPPFLDALRDHGVEFVVGTDSHATDEIGPRIEAVHDLLHDRGFDPITLPAVA
ncbi:MAG: PHP domain-containing protein [Halobaculum sp.]